jgi:hypothetical protein
LKKKSFFNILNNWNKPIYLRDVLIYKLASILFKKNDGFYIFNEQWDNLILLDACRYDIFKEECHKIQIDGKIEERKSRGSHTTTFLKENFPKRKYNDIVYITANPYVNKLVGNKVFKVVSVWLDDWDDKYHTVLPETMYQRTLEELSSYPEKKFIIHFMQPHYPYIGYNLGFRYLDDLKESIIAGKTRKELKKNKQNFFRFYGIDLYSKIEIDSHFELYRSNLRKVLPYVKKLANQLPGKTVVSADHGEALGEYLHPLVPIKIFGHNECFRMPVLINIPWLVLESNRNSIDNIHKIEEKKKLGNAIRKLSFNNE